MTSTLPVPSKVDDEYKRGYLADVFQARVFGAFLSAAEHRKSNYGVTRKEIAVRSGKDETAVSKTFSRPQNWTLKTVSDLAYALDLDVEFALVDRKDRDCVFLDVGFRRRRLGHTNCLAPEQNNNAPTTEYTNMLLHARMRVGIFSRVGQVALPGQLCPADNAALGQ